MNYINITAKNQAKGKELTHAPFAQRGNYIANVKDNHAKLAHFWAQNCISESDVHELDMLNHEIELIKAQNTRVKTNKSLHVAITLPEGESLAKEAWKDVEQELSCALGLEEHQRLCAVHKDTADEHLHIAYNLVHPITFKKHSPYQDMKAGSEVCRTMEAKYGLKVDVGYKEAQQQDKSAPKSIGAKDMEAHTHHQSFERFILEQKKAILKRLDTAKGWQDVHQAFADHDLKLKKHGNGLVISQDKKSMKASSFDRSCSKNALEKRFGKFKTMSRKVSKTRSSTKKYGIQPKFPLRGSALKKWQRYLKVRKDEKAILSWKDYLMLEAGFDPLAMALIKVNKGMIDAFTSKTTSLPTLTRNRSSKTRIVRPEDFSMEEAKNMGAFEEIALDLEDVVENNKVTKKDGGIIL